MASVKAGNITKNMYIIFRGTPHRVAKADFMSPGKGSAFMRLKLKNVVTGNSIDFTYKSSESVEEADVTKKELQFLYSDSSEVVFMDERSYEQVSIPLELIEDRLGFLTPEIRVQVLFYQDKAIGVLLPPNVTLTVTEAQEAVAGNRVNAPKKSVTLETGMEILAPLFIKTGDRIIVDTDSGDYLSRSSE